MNADAWDAVGVLQPDGFPGFSGVKGLEHSVAVRYVASDGLFTTTGVDHVRIPFTDRHGANGAAEIAVRYILPGIAARFRFPHAAASAAEIGLHRLSGHTGDGGRAPAPIGANTAVGECAD